LDTFKHQLKRPLPL